MWSPVSRQGKADKFKIIGREHGYHGVTLGAMNATGIPGFWPMFSSKIPGFLPMLGEELSGCVFTDRCAIARAVCREEEPPLHQLGERHGSRCHFHDEAQQLPRVIPADLEQTLSLDRSGTALVRVQDLEKVFHQHGHTINALAGVSASIWAVWA